MPHHHHQGYAAGTRWDPGQYTKFADDRLRPAIELLGRIPLEAPVEIYDVGCGAGTVTRMIAEKWPFATVYGLDNSREMLEKAAKESARVQWVETDIRSWKPMKTPDLIFSNATLQWVEKHEELFPCLVRYLNPGGCLAVQMPLSWDLPSHRFMRETLADGGPEGQALGTEVLRESMARRWVEDATVYYHLLSDYTSSLDIWETEYLHVLRGDDPVLEWVTGTGLRPILNSLNGDALDLFLKKYRSRLRTAYPARPDGITLYPFRRLFMVAIV